MSTIHPAVMSTFDEWDVIGIGEAEKPKEYLEFNTPPLALVIAMRNAGKAGYDIHEALVGVGKHRVVDVSQAISVEDQKQAATIYDYFAKKHTMRRLKNEYISQFMLAVDALCENRKLVDIEHAKILVSLPRIYEQNCALERVMKGRKSAKKIETLNFAAWRGEIEFVEKVSIKTNRTNEVHYYFSTPKNYLMRVVVKQGEYGTTAWDVLSRAGKLNVDAEVVYTYNIRGYDFNVLQFSPEHTEVKI